MEFSEKKLTGYCKVKMIIVALVCVCAVWFRCVGYNQTIKGHSLPRLSLVVICVKQNSKISNGLVKHFHVK